MKLKFCLKLSFMAFAMPALANAQSLGDYRTATSGDYNTTATWQVDSAAGWVNATNYPHSGNNATVQAGHTITLAGTGSAFNLTVQSAGKIKWAGTTIGANSLRIYGTLLTNNGTIGGAVKDDSINIEVAGPTRCTIGGVGVTVVNRLRILGTANTSGANAIINMPITFTNQSAILGSGVGLTAYYGSSSTNSDIDTVTINPGITVSFINGAVLHYQSITNTNIGGGSYIYNINGIADLSKSVGTTYFSPIPVNAASVITLNITGVLKLGANFSTIDSTVYTSGTSTPGSVKLNVLANGIVDASPTTFNMDLSYCPTFNMASSALMKRYISGSSFAVYPVSISDNGNNTLALHSLGAADTFFVGIQAFTFTSVTANTNDVVNRQWVITETGTGGKFDSLIFTWLAADQGFAVTATPSVYYRPATGTQVEFGSPAVTVTGAGTAVNPYVAVLAVPSGKTAGAGTYFIGKAGLPSAVANVANTGDINVTVVPNPTTGKQISFQLCGTQAGIYKVAVYNLAGQVVYSSHLNYSAHSASYKVDLGNMPAGTYQLQVGNGQYNTSKRVVVE
jgi:hypothetical protein